MQPGGLFVDTAWDDSPPIRIWAVRFRAQPDLLWRPITTRMPAEADAIALKGVEDAMAESLRLLADHTHQQADQCAARGHGCAPAANELWLHTYWRQERRRSQRLMLWCQYVADYNDSIQRSGDRTRLCWRVLWRGQWQDFRRIDLPMQPAEVPPSRS